MPAARACVRAYGHAAKYRHTLRRLDGQVDDGSLPESTQGCLRLRGESLLRVSPTYALRLTGVCGDAGLMSDR